MKERDNIREAALKILINHIEIIENISLQNLLMDIAKDEKDSPYIRWRSLNTINDLNYSIKDEDLRTLMNIATKDRETHLSEWLNFEKAHMRLAINMLLLNLVENNTNIITDDQKANIRTSMNKILGEMEKTGVMESKDKIKLKTMLT